MHVNYLSSYRKKNALKQFHNIIFLDFILYILEFILVKDTLVSKLGILLEEVYKSSKRT